MGGQFIRLFLAAFTPLLGDLRYEYISVLEKNENLVKLINRINELRRKGRGQTQKERKKSENGDKGRKWYPFF